MRGFFQGDDMEVAEYEGRNRAEREQTLDRVVVRPNASGRGVTIDPVPDENSATGSIANTPSSPVEILTAENTDDREENTERLGERNRSEPIQIPNWLQEIRTRPTAVRPSRLAPINLMKGLDPYNIEAAMISVKPEISFPQLLDVSPRLRHELAILLRSSQPPTRKKKATLAVQIDKVAGPIKVTDAAPDMGLECMYITVW